MTRSKLIRTTIVSLAGAAVLGQPAFAGGEPKNQPPFTRPVDARSTQAVTRPAAQPQIQGETKNDVPFTRPATIVVASSGSDGFDWTAGAIGVGAGLGLALAGTGAVLVARKSPLSA